MLTNHHTLRAVVADLGPKLVGCTIGSAWSQTEAELTLGLTGPDGTETSLAFSCAAKLNALVLRPGVHRARRNTVELFDGLPGATLGALTLDPADRIVTLALSPPEHGRLVMHLFGPRANVFWLDPTGRIRDAFLAADDLRDLAYAAPRATAPDPTADGPLVKTLVRRDPTLGPTLAREIAFRLGWADDRPMASLSDAERKQLADALAALHVELAVPRPTIDEDADGVAVSFSLVPLSHRAAAGLTPVSQPNGVAEAVRVFIGRRLGAESLHEARVGLIRRLGQRIGRTERALERLTETLLTSDRAERYERWASLLMAQPDRVPPGATEATLVDWFDADGGEVVVPLVEPRLSPIQNAERYFAKARHARAAEAASLVRHGETERQLVELSAIRDEAESCRTRTEFLAFSKRHDAALRSLTGGDEDSAPTIPFRRWTVAGGFEVWVGKNAAQNDLLLTRHAKRDDLWFHARDIGGSHVILRTGSAAGVPSKAAVEAAAALAAWFSQARGTPLVAVQMTERKYVRKKRGAAPGAVTLEREQAVLLVQPAMPTA